MIGDSLKIFSRRVFFLSSSLANLFFLSWVILFRYIGGSVIGPEIPLLLLGGCVCAVTAGVSLILLAVGRFERR